MPHGFRPCGIIISGIMEDNVNETIREIKHHFMAYRNGIVADTMHRARDPHKVIFGLQLPQLSMIAQEVKAKEKMNSETALKDIACRLWADIEVRESRLLACYLMPPAVMTREIVLEWAGNLRTREEADILAFRLLKRLHYASELPLLTEAKAPYLAEALRRNLQ